MKRLYLKPLILLLAVGLIGCKSNNNNNDVDDGPLSLPITGTSADCVDDIAGDTFPCQNIDLLANINTTQLMGDRLNDIWGWTDPATGEEYALVGLNDGVTFVNISVPSEPRIIGKLRESVNKRAKRQNPSATLGCGMGFIKAKGFSGQGSIWRDFKVYQNNLYVVSDGQIHGMQVFDLTQLRDVEEGDPIQTYTHDELYDEVDNAHNIYINEDTGFGYIVGATNASMCDDGGLHMVDLNDPENPEFAGCFAETSVQAIVNPGYVHDTQCIIYDGPDADYTGQEICFNASETALVIANVNDKGNPQTVSQKTYTGASYAHQGWLTEDRNYYLMNDELDETNNGSNTRTLIWDIQDLDDPQLVGSHQFNTGNIDHNLYINGNYVYESNYRNGFRILSLDDLSTASLSEVAFFDTYPEDDADFFDGAWSSYPFFESGVLIVSDINRGLFILSPNIQ